MLAPAAWFGVLINTGPEAPFCPCCEVLLAWDLFQSGNWTSSLGLSATALYCGNGSIIVYLLCSQEVPGSSQVAVGLVVGNRMFGDPVHKEPW